MGFGELNKAFEVLFFRAREFFTNSESLFFTKTNYFICSRLAIAN